MNVSERHPESLSTSAAFLAYELLFAAAVVLFTPHALLKMIRTPAYRSGIGQRFSLQTKAPPKGDDARPLWIQAVSVGEVKSVTPLVRKLNTRSGLPIHLTTTTETGYRLANEIHGTGNTISYFPLDFASVARRALMSVRPRAIVLFETEIWPNFIRAANSLGIPLAIINGRISEKSLRFYRLFPQIFGNAFSRIDFAGMQSERDAERALALGANPDVVKVYGNMKFDATPTPPTHNEIEGLRRQLGLEKDVALVVAGSTHEGEETAIINAYRKIHTKMPHARLLVAPRHPERFSGVENMIRNAGFKVWKRSESGDGSGPDAGTVILLDTIGELARVYALASVSFVGGSLAKIGGHNIIEPASMGKPVLFGPHMHHFEDIKETFLAEDAAIRVNDETDLASVISDMFENPSKARALGKAAKRVVEANRGATDRYLDALEKYLGAPTENAKRRNEHAW